jgi:hypothetical protein
MPAPSRGITLNARSLERVLPVNQSHRRWIGDTNMRRVLLIPTIVTLTTTLSAVSGSSQIENPAPQASQHGVVAQTVNRAVITLEYDRPVARGRELFGNLVEYDAIWTPGANRSTWIDFSEPVELEGHPLEAGRYGIWMVPKENEPWEVVVVSDWDRDHGLFPFGAEVFQTMVTPEAIIPLMKSLRDQRPRPSSHSNGVPPNEASVHVGFSDSAGWGGDGLALGRARPTSTERVSDMGTAPC